MTISSTTRKAGPYVGNGVTTSFAFSFKVFTAADVVVTKTTVATGAESVLVLTTDYTVSLNADQNANPGGSVTYNPSGTPMASTHTLTLTSNVLQTQGTDIPSAGGWYPEVVENALDKSTILTQQITEVVNRTIRFPVSESGAVQLPAAAQRASKIIGFDANGDVTVYPASSTAYGVLYDRHIASAGQTVFNIGFQYSLGIYNLRVFVDGFLQRAYTETGTSQVTFSYPLQAGMEVEFFAGQETVGAVGDASSVSYTPSGTGAVVSNVRDKLRESVSVKDFGAVGDGVINDWEACQKACDYIQSLGGGVVWFPPGVYRIAGNTIILWGNNVLLLGYGATLYKDNAGGSAGTYGDALTVFGKLNGNLYWSPQVAGGTYSTPAAYGGATTPSKNITIEGFKVTFGTHSSDTINGISGINYEHLTVRNCETVDAPQTGFAWIATDNAHATHLTLDNCFSNGAGMQGFRFNSYTPNAGELTAKVINCRTEGTVLTVATPWPEQYDLPSSAFVRSSGGDLQFQVSFDNCQFDEAVHLLDGYRTTSFRNCRLAHVFALNASAHCALEFDNCRFREFDVATGFGGIDAQLFARNTHNGQAKISLKNCTFETPAAGDYTIYNRGFDLDVENCIGQTTIYSIDWSTYLPITRIRGGHLKDPSTSPLTFAGDLVEIDQCRIYTPIDIIQAHRKTIKVSNSRFIVDASFATYCIVVTHGNVVAEGNIVEYTDNGYATILVAPVANTLLKNNQYLYDGDTTFSKDEIYGTAAPANGYWQVSSRVINSAPSAGQPKAWVCTVAGAPGTWVSEGNL